MFILLYKNMFMSKTTKDEVRMESLGALMQYQINSGASLIKMYTSEKYVSYVCYPLSHFNKMRYVL